MTYLTFFFKKKIEKIEYVMIFVKNHGNCVKSFNFVYENIGATSFHRISLSLNLIVSLCTFNNVFTLSSILKSFSNA